MKATSPDDRIKWVDVQANLFGDAEERQSRCNDEPVGFSFYYIAWMPNKSEEHLVDHYFTLSHKIDELSTSLRL